MARKAMVRTFAVTGVAGGLAVLLAILFWPRPLAVVVEQVRVGPIAETVADQGWARTRQNYVIAAPVAGRLERLPVEVGDIVTSGRTVVARVRPASPGFLDERSRRQAEAALAAAEADAALARADRLRLEAAAALAETARSRQARLAGAGYASAQVLDEATAQARMAAEAARASLAAERAQRARVAQARAALTGPGPASGPSVAVTAPANGVVVQLLQQSERDVAAGAPLVAIGATDDLEAQIEFLSQDAARIRPGQAAEVYDWGGPRLAASVRRVEPAGYTKISALGVEEQRTLVWLSLNAEPAAREGLAPGYRVWGRVFLRRAEAARLCPTGALVRDRGGWAVFRLENGRARLRPVTVGAMSDTDAEIVSGLAPGDRVIVYPSDQVRDGRSVRATTP